MERSCSTSRRFRRDQDEPAPDPHPNRDATLTVVVVPDTPVPPIPPTPPPLPPEPTRLSRPVQPYIRRSSHPPQPGTRLALHKTAAPHTVQAGQSISYTLRLSNVGDASALGVRLCDRPPAGVIITSAPGFKRVGRSVCTRILRLNTQTHRTFHLTARARLRTRGTSSTTRWRRQGTPVLSAPRPRLWWSPRRRCQSSPADPVPAGAGRLQLGRRELGAVRERLQLQPGDVRIDQREADERVEAAVGPGQQPFLADDLAERTSRSATSRGCSTQFDFTSITPRITDLSSGSSTSSNTRHSCAWRGLAPST